MSAMLRLIDRLFQQLESRPSGDGTPSAAQDEAAGSVRWTDYDRPAYLRRRVALPLPQRTVAGR